MPRLLPLVTLLVASNVWAAPGPSTPPGPSTAGETDRLRFEALKQRFFASETERVRAHLQTVEAELRAVDVSGWTPSRQRARAESLDALHAYWQARRFPWNDVAQETLPVFVDHRGTRCAMAHVLEATGAPELVRFVRAHDNTAYVPELARFEGLVDRLDAIGLTVTEAARVQPTYGGCVSRAEQLCGTPRSTVARGRVASVEPTSYLEGATQVRIEIDQVMHEGDDDVEVGSVASTSVFRFPIEVDEELVVVFGGAGRSYRNVLPLRGDRVIIADPCEPGLGVPVDRVVELATRADCIEQLEITDPRWAGGWCRYHDELTCPGPDEGPTFDRDDGTGHGPPSDREAPEPPAPDETEGSLEPAGGCAAAPPGSSPTLVWVGAVLFVARRRPKWGRPRPLRRSRVRTRRSRTVTGRCPTSDTECSLLSRLAARRPPF